ncbi:pimeloyl-ACP methyl ester carboxylesterase [Streptosporangium becharense]|uniref:Pimeloyl-ACP methyl ester carboxylesterase n=1 Tax=Streptosporangium becharense TaxID=1816182 RepID=A0A7W9IAL1_9ACTN|nr:alpha/beta hydrolase [Streptosporangium becharense]MBB2914188.1 pimeloyl-ACP methyl ester carboxylesterase [Streptosporangium becharense]MBB5817215.1 pimeloyl-ACP methyl ester carboxylesterase [Streptosporangium becharense]
MNTATTAEQTLTLADGRRMGYTVLGDPSGRPCLLVHGYSSSRWVAGWTLPDTLLYRHGVRLVSVDRPGYGRSTPHPDAGFTAWACDAAELIAHLGFGRVAVIGVSMGAGPALALGAAHPDLVTATTVLSGMAPVEPGERWAPASRGDALYWRLARRAPRVLRRLCSLSAVMTAAAARGDTDRLIARVQRGLPPADRAVFRELLDGADSGARAAFLADVRESTRQGGAAMADDLRRYLRPWDFDPADVAGPVRLWHGLDDPKVPVALARRLADRLPDATATFVPGGHLAPFSHRDEIIAPLGAAGSPSEDR